ncbi:MAG TPA: acetyl-CoA C-acetyltransferase [Thermoleophilia bacterium]|nr:acetyl-CoA C-acetyltransferase [Thermoleophilia bacterium]HQJ97104.1 acetyl-CoA C-acetyltransferase [Thermoleophilia bacterium]
MSDNDIVILSAVRTAQGRFQGGLSDTPAQELGAIVMKEALDRAGVKGDQLDEVIFGNVIQAGLGQNVARQAELKAGIPQEVPAITVNRVCVSSAAAMAMAATAIKAGDGDLYLVGGTENMTRAPWLLQNGRKGYRMGMPSDQIFDAMVLDGLWCAIGNTHMGLTAETLSERYGVTKEEQNDVAYQSQARALAAIKSGRFKDEIVPVAVPQRKGEPKIVDTDECPRETTPEALANLKPVFKKDGVVTAGNSSAISDGASALVVSSRKKAKELGLKPIAQLISYATAAVDPAIMGYGETKAGRMALAKAGLTGKDVQLAELNEAFACVMALARRELGLDPDIVNVNGGAVALGHPLGNTGTRLVVTLIHELKKRGREIGLTAACVGGGQGAGAVIKAEG